MNPSGLLAKTLSLSKTHSGLSVKVHATAGRPHGASTLSANQRTLSSEGGPTLSAPASVLSALGQQQSGGPDLQYRVYKFDSQAFSQVSLGEDAVLSALNSAASETWREILAPETPEAQRTKQLSQLFSLAAGDAAEGPGNVPGDQPAAYTGVVFMPAASPASSDSEATQVAVGAGARAPRQAGSWAGAYGVRKVGAEGTLEHRVFVQREGQDISAWHDIPLFNPDGTINFVCEIPRETTAKMEVATKEADNPVKQDEKKGLPRHYPYAINWNYGMIPQTWEDPARKDEAVGDFGGDNDPVDVVEIGSSTLATGGVYAVKPLGAYAMIDGGELDWKVICIAADDPLAPQLNTIADVERCLPGELERIMLWFRDYKIPDGKPPNEFGLNSRPVGDKVARQVISQTHSAYRDLVEGATPNVGNLSLA